MVEFFKKQKEKLNKKLKNRSHLFTQCIRRSRQLKNGKLSTRKWSTLEDAGFGLKERRPWEKEESDSVSEEHQERYLKWDGILRETQARRQNIRQHVLAALRGREVSWETILEVQKQYVENKGLKAPAGLMSHTVAAFPELGEPPKTWRRAVKALDCWAKRRGPTKPPMAAPSELLAVASSLPLLPRVALALQILHMTRLSTILALQVKNLYKNPFVVDGVSLVVTEHKTHRTLGSYTAHLVLPPNLHDDLVLLAEKRKNSKYLFPQEGNSRRDIYNAIRKALAPLGVTVKSVRPSMLTAAAVHQIDKAQQLMFSRHSTERALLQYQMDGLLERYSATEMPRICRQIPEWTEIPGVQRLVDTRRETKRTNETDSSDEEEQH